MRGAVVSAPLDARQLGLRRVGGRDHGLALGLVAGLPVVALVHSSIDYPLVSAFAWVLCAAGVRIGVTKGQEIVRPAGLSHLVDRPADPPPGTALLVDSSAVMDRYLLVLGQSGLLAGGVVLPRFVIDEVRALSHSPDPVASRRAHRGLEALEALRSDGVELWMNEDEVPELEDSGDRALALARRLHVRLGTCSAELAERAEDQGIDVVDLRRLAAELSPDHPPGERLVIDLVKEGRQPRQAVGYLPEGDMVVVNDASHLVGNARHRGRGVLGPPDEPGTARLRPALRGRPEAGPTRQHGLTHSRRGWRAGATHGSRA